MNTELLLKVKAAILEEPKRLDIWVWQARDPRWTEAPACGTVGCIAGWADILNRTQGTTSPEIIRSTELSTYVVKDGREALGITREQSNGLFIPDKWPEDLAIDLHSTRPGEPGHASVVARAIDRFIANPSEFEVDDEDDEFDEFESAELIEDDED